MAIEKTHLYKVDLARALTKTAINAVFSTDNKQADVFVLDVLRNGHREDLSNIVVTGTFVCHSNDITVPVTMGGRVEENKAILTLSDGCYLASGLCTISIHLSIGEKLSTIFIGTLLMNQTATDTVLDPDNVIPSISELLAQIEAIRQATRESEQATEAADEAAENANNAASRANRAASAIENMTVSATGLATGEEATVTVTEGPDGKHLSFGIPRGEKGEKGEKGDPGTIENVTITSIAGLPEALESVDAVKLGGKGPKYYVQIINLLANSNFLKPINHRGNTSGNINWQYFIDRWILASVTSGERVYYSINQEGAGIGFSTPSGGNFYLVQRIPKGVINTGKTYTVGYEKSTGEKVVVAASFNTTNEAYDAVNIIIPSGTYVRWIAMLEGAYTIDNFPDCKPNENAVEHLKCQQFWFPLDYNMLGAGYTIDDGGWAILHVPTPLPMIGNVSFVNTGTVYARVNGVDYPLQYSSINRGHSTFGTNDLEILFTNNSLPAKQTAFFHGTADCYLTSEL